MFKGLKLDPEYLEEENIIAKLQLVMQLERASPYAKGSVFDPLSDRMLRSLRSIPEEFQQYVLALFANTFYCTEQFSTTIMLHLYNTMLYEFKIKQDEFAEKCLVLEVDPTGMINEFLRLNKVQGRLDKKLFPREQQLDSFVNKMILKRGFDDLSTRSNDIKNTIEVIKKEAKFEDDSHQLEKEFWVVLTDNVLSGTSLCSAIKRLILLSKSCKKSPTIIILIRTLSDHAKKQFNDDDEIKQKINENKIVIKWGLMLKEEYTIRENYSSKEDGRKVKCQLFKNSETISQIIKASEWLISKDEYKNDPFLIDHFNTSGDDLKLGFKQCGLTYVSAENCPSNSLPLLWYKNDNCYIAPFPRVLSRVVGNNNVKK